LDVKVSQPWLVGCATRTKRGLNGRILKRPERKEDPKHR
jgi:hypothetical protein